MFEFLLLDLDDTILDFKKSEQYAIRKTLLDAGITPTQQICDRYSQINDMHWKWLELGQITREQVIVGRFQMLFQELGVDGDFAASAWKYMDNLSSVHYFIPGAEEAVAALYKKYRLFLVSNGTASAQERRLKSANLNRFFEKVFISQNVGINKPHKGFFDYCFSQIPGFDREKALIVGDSLSSDMLGGQNAGIATCWVNPGGKPRREGIRVDYEIKALSQLESLLESV